MFFSVSSEFYRVILSLKKAQKTQKKIAEKIRKYQFYTRPFFTDSFEVLI